ncbi:crosslink repair DNA glycosylase YcaQ family protein [Fulvivirgaceae bacterium BMA10]|uniref:Crosslink repair DNA glycosylase YcaQ family protein n=1 Tax=Splendidivirga corallicola TaxID=3051826 RepID=A0ABT8KNQ5_9BACT|nr:crosslink repair DNA glycosylase YcaQ family protein [Fulvivirgaceae bacterium BMA10]
MTVETIPLKAARKIILSAQQLIGNDLKGTVKNKALTVIQHLGYIQIDTISVVERAHHHTFWTRLHGYRPKILQTLEERDKAIFEYWSHAASYLPMTDYRFTLPFKQSILNADGYWFKKDADRMNHVYNRIKTEGPLMSKDFEKPENFTSSDLYDWAPYKRALHNLFMEGRIMVARRNGFQKVYDLTERVLPHDVDATLPDRKEYLTYLIKRDIRAHGLVRSTEVGYLLKGIRNEVKAILRELEQGGDIKLIKIKNASEDLYYIDQKLWDNWENKKWKKRIKILCPFDNAIINRKRTKEVFHFDYTLECYVPQKKRKFGYFSLPILWGETFVGQLDAKTDRKHNQLLIKNLEFNNHLKDIDEIIAPFGIALKEYAIFNQCEEIVFEDKPAKKYPQLSIESNSY